MARVTSVKASRVARTCGRTGHEIPPGSFVYSAAPGWRGRTQYRCKEHPFRQSELTTSKTAEALAAVEAFEDAAGAIEVESTTALDDLTAAWEELTSAVRQYADERREAADAWENGNSLLEELADTAEAAADELEEWEPEEWDGDPELLEWAEEEPTDPGDEPEEPDPADFDDDEDFDAARNRYEVELAEWQDAYDAHEEWEQAHDEAQEAIDSWNEHVEEQIAAAIELATGLEY